MGGNATIVCRSDIASTEKIEWLRDGEIVIAVRGMIRELNLTFTPVNDIIHGQVYTCRVTRNITDIAEQNFTMNVEGKLGTEELSKLACDVRNGF